MMLTFTLLFAVSAMLSPEKASLDDSLKKFESKYEQQYQEDLKERMDAAEKEKQQDEQKPTADPDELDAPELKAAPEDLDATPHPEAAAPPAPKMDALMGALAGLTPAALGAHGADEMDGPSVDEALEKLKTSAKMMVVLHVLMKPISAKLQLAMSKMGDADKAKSQGILDHLGELDGLSEKAVELLKHVETVKHGSPEERKAALENLVTGMKDIQSGVQTHLLAMRRPAIGEHAPAMSKGQSKLHLLTAKLHEQMHKMEAKVKAELADPARKDDPMTKLDMEVLDTMKNSVKKAESLVVVAAVAMKQAKDEDQKTKIKAAIKAELQGVMVNLKTEMSHLKEKTVIVEAVNKLKSVGGLKGLLTHLAEQKKAEAEQNAEASVDADGNTAQDAPEAEPKDEAADTKPEEKGKDASPARPPASDGKFDNLLDQLDALKGSFKGKDSANLRKNAAEDEEE